MYAIIRTGGRQFRAEVGKLLDLERLPYDVDHKFTINEVLLVGNGDSTVIGRPLVDGASVDVTVISQYRAKKVLVFKYRQRTKYRRMRGHRHYYTRVRIDAINL